MKRYQEPGDQTHNTIKYQWRKKQEKPNLFFWIAFFLVLEGGLVAFLLWL